MLKKFILLSSCLTVVLAIVIMYVTPWPSVLVIRWVFDHGARKASQALAHEVPDEVRIQAAIAYDPADPDALLDIYQGAGSRPLGPTVVWFHGGGFVSGRRGDVSNYLKILAGRGFTVVNVDYTIAPEAAYPTPVRQANKALAYLTGNVDRLGLDPGRFVLAGDSAGAQIAAQTAAMLTNPAYAKAVGITPGVQADQIVGAMLFCGVYDVTTLGQGGGLLGWFVQSTGWAYGGRRDWRTAAVLDTMSVAPHVTAAFPTTFITAGNADPLAPQSRALARQLVRHSVKVTELFFAANHQPPLGHEYQFDLGTAAGRLALDHSVSWLDNL